MKNILLVTHVFYRNALPVAGPYTSIIQAIEKIGGYKLETLKLNLSKSQIVFILDVARIFFYLLLNGRKHNIVICIDPLCTFPAAILKRVCGYKLVFYAVDYNESRFKNSAVRTFYNFTNYFCGKYADCIWAVSQKLQEMFKKAVYVPNSFPFDKSYYEKGVALRTGNKFAWTGSITTPKQITYIKNVCEKILEIRPDAGFYFLPFLYVEEMKKEMADLKNAQVIVVNGRVESLEQVSKYDFGLAIYDPDFGSIEYIEPLKIWEYMMCGLPFIISREPSLNYDIKQSGIAFVLGDNNKISNTKNLSEFLLSADKGSCIELAKKYAPENTIAKSLEDLE